MSILISYDGKDFEAEVDNGGSWLCTQCLRSTVKTAFFWRSGMLVSLSRARRARRLMRGSCYVLRCKTGKFRKALKRRA